MTVKSYIIMRQFIDTELISLIKESSNKNVSNAEWVQAYDAFAEIVFAASKKFAPIAYHESLCYTKAELGFWQSEHDCRRKKRKATSFSLQRRSI